MKDNWTYLRNEFSYLKIHEFAKRNGIPIPTPEELDEMSDTHFEALRAKAAFWLQSNKQNIPQSCVICGLPGLQNIGPDPNVWICKFHMPQDPEIVEMAHSFNYLHSCGSELRSSLMSIIKNIEDANTDGICKFCNVDLIQGDEHKSDCLMRKLESVKITNATSPFAIWENSDGMGERRNLQF